VARVNVELADAVGARHRRGLQHGPPRATA
jgi:hypothetical protein